MTYWQLSVMSAMYYVITYPYTNRNAANSGLFH